MELTKALLRNRTSEDSIDLQNSSGNTALHLAIQRGSTDVAKMLLKHGA